MSILLVITALVLVLPTTIRAQDLVQKALDDSYFNWKSTENAAARVYYKPHSFAERHRATLLRSVTVAIEEDLEFFGEPTYDKVLNVFYVGDREEMERIVGRPVLADGQLPPLGELPAKFAELGEIRGGIYAASVLGFIRRVYGPDVLRELWTNGSVKLPNTLGTSFDKIEESWKEYLERDVAGGVQVDVEAIKDSGCG